MQNKRKHDFIRRIKNILHEIKQKKIKKKKIKGETTLQLIYFHFQA